MRLSVRHTSSRAARQTSAWRAEAMGERRSKIPQKRRLPPTPNTRSRRGSYGFGFRPRVKGQDFTDFHAIRSLLFPLIQRQAVGFEQFPDVPCLPVQNLIENRHHDAECAFAEHRTLGNSRKLLVFRNS